LSGDRFTFANRGRDMDSTRTRSTQVSTPGGPGLATSAARAATRGRRPFSWGRLSAGSMGLSMATPCECGGTTEGPRST
jgi:hypothetical protein